MIIKRISCKVKESKKEAFFDHQKQWQPLSEVNGFLGQLGGWSTAEPLTACIYSFWKTQREYAFFMEEIHDEIVDRSGQRGAYESIDIRLFEENLENAGMAAGILDIVVRANYIRASLSLVKDAAVRHFADMQEIVWNPGMQKSEGMLGGTFAFSQKQRNLCLVLTGWESEAVHRGYMEESLPKLLKMAETKHDVLELTGEEFKVEEEWRVCPDRSN
ncbi:YdbC family protein [Mangrovibacillus sp. Mu-81]|uniref:YdbC family protein n=1 Tax=Mangrovibacillus sp. Mu-81 TaxID=3121478 RepID=UPI002FE4B67D